MMPPDWAVRCVERLLQQTKRTVRLRPHPGNNAPQKPLIDDLRGAWAVYIWSSTAGIHALVEGIPVFCEAPYWILKPAGAGGSPDEPVCPDRLPAFERMALGQFTLREIESGHPFSLLSAAKQAESEVSL